jgi:flagellar protein FliJ
MARLDTIIRLRKWELDEARRVLADLLGEREVMVRQLVMMDDEIAEQSRSTSIEVFSTTVGAYMDGVKKRGDAIHNMLAEKEKEIEQQQDKVAEGFRELKTFQIAHDRDVKRAKWEEDKAEQVMFDELGTQDHARRDAVTESEYLNMRD